MSIGPSEVQIIYPTGVDYIINVTNNASDFLVESSGGVPQAVTQDTAINLFSTSKAIEELEIFHQSQNIDGLVNTWSTLERSAGQVVAGQAILSLLGQAGGLVLASAVGADIAVAPTVVGTLADLVTGESAPVADLAITDSFLNTAKSLLQQADVEYDSITSGQSVSLSTVQTAINTTLYALYLGQVGTAAAQNIPGMNNSLLDDVLDFAKSLVGPIAGAVSEGVGIFAGAAAEFPELTAALNSVQSLSGLVDQVSSVSDQASFLASILDQAAFNNPGPFGTQELAQAKIQLTGSSVELSGTQPTSFSISPLTPTVSEKGGVVSFTITPNNPNFSGIVYVSTVQNGTQNPGQDYYYNGFANKAVTITNGHPVTVQVTTVDRGLTSGSETFDFIVQKNSTDPTSVYLGKASFTIQNNDPAPTIHFQFNPTNPSVNESGGIVYFSLSRDNASAASTVYVSTLHSDPAGNPGGDHYYDGLLNLPVTFAVGQTTAQVGVTINDLGLTTGSETFGIIAQQDPTQPTTTNVAQATFTILNNDSAPGGQQLGPTATPSLTALGSVSVQVGAVGTITSSLLQATDAAYPNPQSLTYIIVNPPSFGAIQKNGVNVSTFTQADIDNGVLQYKENGSSASSDAFTFEVLDPAGNHTSIATFDVQISSPTNPPPVSTPDVTIQLSDDTGISASDSLTSNPTLTGTADPNATVTLSESGVTLGTTQTNNAGVWTFNPSGLAQGFHVVQASETNAAGRTGTSLLDFVFDSIVPANPSAPQISGGNISLTATPTFSGTAGASDNATVLLLEGSTIIGSGPAIAGDWTITADPLSVGAHTITAEAIDQAGNVSGLSAATAFFIQTPPPGEVILNDATMIDANDLSVVGTVTPPEFSGFSGTLTEYGPLAADGFTLSDESRSGFSFVTWDSAWAFTHNAESLSEYFDGSDVLIVPTDGLLVATPDHSAVPRATADTMDLRRTDGSAFSFNAVDLGPTGNDPTFAIFTGTTASGGTVTETFELNTAQGKGLQTVELTGFGDVTDVTFTERFNQAGDDTSVEFDNFVLGNPIPPATPPTSGPLTAPVVLDDDTMSKAGALPLVHTETNVFSGSHESSIGTITFDGFTLSNLDRADFAFETSDSNFDAVDGYFYDGPNTLITAFGTNSSGPARISVTRKDGVAFSFTSIALDTMDSESGVTVQFTGIKPDGTQVFQTVQLDNSPGMQTFDFGPQFADLTSLQFVSSVGDIQFNDIALGPADLPNVSAFVLAQASDSGVKGDNITYVTDPVITGFGTAGDTVTLFDGNVTAGSATVQTDGTWSVTTSKLSPGGHSLTAIETDTAGNRGPRSLAVSLNITQMPVPDFNGDGTSDILWRNNTNGQVLDWQMSNGTKQIGVLFANPGSALSFAGTGDFNGDGTTDILWRNSNGALSEWVMVNGAHTKTVGLGSPGSAWSFQGIGDFNGDGTSDILWRNNTNGQVLDWQMSNGTKQKGVLFANPGSALSFAGIGDFNGDGTTDILWRNSNGALSEWVMVDGAHTKTIGLGSPGSAWSSENPTSLIAQS